MSLKLTVPGLNTIFETMAEASDHVLWIRSPDYLKQLYVSPGYEKVWQRPSTELYENPMCWIDYLVDNPDNQIGEALYHRTEETNTGIYQIHTNQQTISTIQDKSFFLYDSCGNKVAVAGICKVIDLETIELTKGKFLNDSAHILLREQNNFMKIFSKELKLSDKVINQKLFNKKTLFKHAKEPTLTVKLSRREIDCLNQLLLGKNSREIADYLSISVRTVEAHIDNCRGKLGCRTRIEMLTYLTKPGTIYD